MTLFLDIFYQNHHNFARFRFIIKSLQLDTTSRREIVPTNLT